MTCRGRNEFLKQYLVIFLCAIFCGKQKRQIPVRFLFFLVTTSLLFVRPGILPKAFQLPPNHPLLQNNTKPLQQAKVLEPDSDSSLYNDSPPFDDPHSADQKVLYHTNSTNVDSIRASPPLSDAPSTQSHSRVTKPAPVNPPPVCPPSYLYTLFPFLHHKPFLLSLLLNCTILQGVVGNKFCQVCQIYRPEGTKHCYLCNNCVAGFDHHCPVVNNCIGQRNHRYFAFFLITCATSLWIYSVEAFTQILKINPMHVNHNSREEVCPFTPYTAFFFSFS